MAPVAIDERFWQAEQQSLAAILLPRITQAAQDGAEQALADLPRDARAGVDWNRVSGAAQQWATEHTYELVKGLTDTSRAFLRDAISEWISSGEPLAELVDNLAPMFGANRANLIAATEVTRAFAQSNRIVWQASDAVTGMRFNTAADDHICAECGPLDGQVFALDDDENAPPLHPGCRCWLSPEVHVPE